MIEKNTLFKQNKNNAFSQKQTLYYVAHVIYIQYLSTVNNNISYV